MSEGEKFWKDGLFCKPRKDDEKPPYHAKCEEAERGDIATFAGMFNFKPR